MKRLYAWDVAFRVRGWGCRGTQMLVKLAAGTVSRIAGRR